MFYSVRNLAGNRVSIQHCLDFRFATRLTVAFLLLLLIAPFANAQDPFLACSPAEKFIEMRVTATSVPGTGATPQRLVWVLSEVPNAENVRLTPADEILKSRISE